MKKNRTRRNLGLPLLQLRLSLALMLFASTLAAQILPPPSSSPKASAGLPAVDSLFVRGYDFLGNRAFSDKELARVTGPFANREINSEDLEEARRAVTLHYVNHGYVNSGAVIPDQDPTNGIITIQIIEGRLSEIELHGNRWLRDSYILGRLRRWSTPPLDMDELREGLQLLRQNPNVEQINAELRPGTAPGESVLDVKLTDQHPFRLGLQFDNQRPPSVGEKEIWLLASDLNLTGHSDPLEIRYGIANSGADGLEFSGVDNLEGSYTLPLTRYDTTLGLHASRLDTSLVEETFLPLDVTSVTTTYGVVLRQPVYVTGHEEAALSAAFDYRKNDSWLLDEPFSLSPGAVDGEMVVPVLRFSQEWVRRGQNHILALRSTFNFGLSAFDATDNGISGDPDAKFFSWLGQAQHVRRLFGTQNQLILRLAGQWTDDRLLALEQISVGGMESVRGYLENQLVRDRGVVSSVEFRVPVWFNKAGAGVVHLAPFFDFGGAWNVDRSPSPTTIYSTGTGLLIEPNRHFSAQLYWGHRLRDVDLPDDAGAQGLGLHFRVNINAF